MKILALIPARGGSKGVPGKNQKLLGGKPLICYTIEAALESSVFTKVVVSTDSPEIAEISKNNGAEVPFMRPAELASDRSPSIDTVIHALEFLEKQGEQFDAVCLLQPTCPFRTAADIKDAITVFEAHDADSLISVREVPHVYNPHWVFLKNTANDFLKIATGEQEIIPRRQELPKAYHRDGSIYITKNQVLKNTKSLYGKNIISHESSNSSMINIDTMSDWEAAEEYLHKVKS